MRAFSAFVLAGLVGCAAPHSPVDTGPDAQTIRVSGAAGISSMTTFSGGPESLLDTLAVAVPVAWRAIPAVYTQLEIPVSSYDAAKNIIGTTGFKTYRRVGKTLMSKLLDCGRTQVGQNAENYEVFLSVFTSMKAVDGDSSRTSVSTTVQAQARPIAFAGEFVACRTKGLLERQIAQELKKLVTS